MLGHFASKVVNPKEHVAEFRVKDEKGLIPPGTLLKPSFSKKANMLTSDQSVKAKVLPV